MAITGVSQEQYADYLENDGELTFLMDAEDIDASRAFETMQAIELHLTSGFELHPSPVVGERSSAALIHGDPWTRAITFTYRRGGTIIYRQLPDGRYDATAAIPKSVPE